jgi:Xaa-Pro aminopeptidase
MDQLTKLRDALNQHDLDGMLITNPYNRRYMTGFTGTAGVVLVTKEKAIFITDFRYMEQASKELNNDYEIIQHQKPIFEEVARLTKDLKVNKIGIEQDHMNVSTFRSLENLVKGSLVPVSSITEKIRMIKTEQELSILQEAAEIADKAFTHILNYIKAGVKELDVSNELEFFMRKKGATASSFDIIVASGYRSALPHGVASDKEIKNGEFVTLDFGAYYKGYCSDITRTVAVGNPSAELQEIYDVVLGAQLKGMNEIKPGMTGKDADSITRNYIEDKGYGDRFGHSTGHGLGLEVHEGPTLSARSKTTLEPGMVVTVEPGIYIPGLGGVRIEDDTVITKEGNKSLTLSSKELIIL